MTKTKFFANPQTMQELKQQYRDLAMQHHPDRPGGQKEAMQQINAEYEELFATLPRANKAEEKESPAEYPGMIYQVINLAGIEIEVIGCWIWITGDTRQHKDYLKTLGFKFAPKKVAWYWKPYKYHKRSKKELGLDEIRQLYGTEKVNKHEEEQPALTR